MTEEIIIIGDKEKYLKAIKQAPKNSKIKWIEV